MDKILDAEIVEPVLTFEPFPEETKEEVMVEEKAEDMLLLHRLYARKQKHLFPNVQEELMKLKEQKKRWWYSLQSQGI